jgi:hypothetical protein
MKTVFRPPGVLVLALLVSVSEGADASNWYARIQGGTRVQDCIEWKEPIDDSIEAMRKKFGACELVTDADKLLECYIVRCGSDNSQIIFRRKHDCEAFKARLEGGGHLDLESLAPVGTRNPTGWVVAMHGCLKFGLPPAVVAAHRVQMSVNYCECVASWAGGFVKDSDVPVTEAALSTTVNHCAKEAFGTQLPKETLRRVVVAIMEQSRKPKGGGSHKVSAMAFSNPSTAVNVPQSEVSPVQSKDEKIRKGDDYESVMIRLKGLNAQKRAYGDYLDAEYKSRELLTYPDADGTCKLEFARGVLKRCSGCSAKRFDCTDSR